jgi:hypothetical protein
VSNRALTNSDEPVTDREVDRKLTAAQDGESTPMARRGKIVSGIRFTAGQETNVNHGLGHEPQGWIPIRVRSAVAGGYPFEVDGKTTTKKMTLVFGADAVIDFMVW